MKNTPTALFSAFLFTFIFSIPMARAQSANPPLPNNPPPGLVNAPPCQEGLAHFPSQAKVPCNGIVLFEDGTSEEEQAAIVGEAGGKGKVHFRHVRASAVQFPSLQSLEGILAHPQVVDVIPDRQVNAYAKPGSGGTTTGQVTPAGVQRIGAPKAWAAATGAGVGVAIVDTGVDFLQTDLNVADPCFDAHGTDCQDRNGHGTHVGGIVAAMDNTQGVIGVAPNATLYSVRVLDASGSGSDSDIMHGLEWILDNHDLVSPTIRVANMSLGREGEVGDNPALHSVVTQLSDAGVTIVVAAGNDPNLEVAQNVPATYPEVLAVASSTAVNGGNQCRAFNGFIKADTASYFTTDGSLDAVTGGGKIGVTISAPGGEKEDIGKNCFLKGVGILSTRLGGGTTRMSGTSMASPHVAGVVALLAEDLGGIDPETARNTLRSSAFLPNIAPYASPTGSYTDDGEKEGILSACQALNVSCN